MAEIRDVQERRKPDAIQADVGADPDGAISVALETGFVFLVKGQMQGFQFLKRAGFKRFAGALAMLEKFLQSLDLAYPKTLRETLRESFHTALDTTFCF